LPVGQSIFALRMGDANIVNLLSRSNTITKHIQVKPQQNTKEHSFIIKSFQEPS